MWNLKYDTNELIYETETDSQKQRTDLWLPRRKGDGGGMDWEFEISRCKLLHIGWINNKALLYRHREQTCGCQGGGMEWEFGISRCKMVYIGWKIGRASCRERV